jgi:plastocyanin
LTPVRDEAAPGETPALPVNGETVEVMIEDNAFDPATVNIFTGDTVRWTNLDSTPHTVTGATFGINNLNPGASYEFLFTDPGTYEYYCEIHPSMEGTVIVKENE